MRSRLPTFVWVLLGIAIPFIAFRIYAVHKLNEQLQAVQKLGVPANANALKRLYPELAAEKTVGTVLTNAAADFLGKQTSEVPRNARPKSIFSGGNAAWPAPEDDLTKELKRLVKLGVQNNRAALKKAKTAIHLKPRRMTKHPSRCWEADRPMIIKTRSLINFLNLEALWRARQGRFQDSATSLLAITKFAEVLAQEHWLVAAINRLKVLKPLPKSIEMILNYGSFNESDTESLLSALSKAETLCRPSLKATLKSEICCAGFAFQSLDESGHPLDIGRETATFRETVQAHLYELFGLQAVDHRFYLRKMKEPLATLNKPMNQWYSMSRVVGSSEVASYLWVSGRILPRLKFLFKGNARLITQLRLVQTALLVETYRAENGGLPPSSLDPVAAQFPGKLPGDPFDGQRVHYQTNGDAYVLYSLGPNKANRVRALPDRTKPTWNIPNDKLTILVQR